MKKGVYYLEKKNYKKVGLAEVIKEADPQKELQEIPFLLTERKKVKKKDGTYEYKYKWSKVSLLPSTYEHLFQQSIDEDEMEKYESLWKRAVRVGTEYEEIDKNVLKFNEFKTCNVFSQGGLIEFLQQMKS